MKHVVRKVSSHRIELTKWIVTLIMNETVVVKVLERLIESSLKKVLEDVNELKLGIVTWNQNENNSGIKFPTIIFCQKH